METRKAGHALIGKALGPVLGVAAFSCLLLAIALYLERGAGTGAVLIWTVGLAGFAALCLIVVRFLRRLSRDLRHLERHAVRIADGEREEPLRLERDDEVRALADAVNALARALAEREREVENARNRLFMDEKLLALGALTAGIAHEIANPIHAILAVCDQLKRGLAEHRGEHGAEEDSAQLDMIVEQTDRMGQVIHELNEFAQPASAELAPTSVNAAVESAIKLLEFDRRFRDIEVSTDLGRDVPIVNAVASQLTLVAINILVNAAEAIERAGGSIVVTTRKEGDSVVVSFHDDGRGMTAEVAERATDLFFTTKSAREGTGLGLAVCRSIIDRHHGTLEIESEPDRGTSMRVYLPVAE